MQGKEENEVATRSAKDLCKKAKQTKAVKQVEKEKKQRETEAFRAKVAPISRILQDELHIGPTMANIRSYLRKKKLVSFQQAKSINEENVLKKWGKYVGN